MIDQFAKELFSQIQNTVNQQGDNLKEAKAFTEGQLRGMLETTLRKLDLVTREEFDAQQAVLLRTREKLEALEARLECLLDEEDLGDSDIRDDSAE